MSEPSSALLVFAHPALERARVNPAMADAVRDMPGLTFHDLYEHYPDFAIDVGREQALLRAHDLIVLQFPFYWYSTPSLLKEWLDLVWLHGFAYGAGGDAMKGKALFCAISTGGRADAYGSEGSNRFTIHEFLRPFEQTAHLCNMHWIEPLAIHGAGLLSDADLERETRRYREHLGQLMQAATTRREAS